ncbi:MAG: hypothetical protein ACLS7Z_10930 [Christensenellales bacterium]
MRQRAKWGFTAAMGWGECASPAAGEYGIESLGARWMRGQSKPLRKGGRLSNTWGGVFHGSGLCRFRGIAPPTANCWSPIRTAKKTREDLSLCQMLSREGDYPFMICDQIDAPEEATAGETKP